MPRSPLAKRNDGYDIMTPEAHVLTADKTEACVPEILRPGRVMRVGVLINPLSGGNRRGIGAVRKVLSEHRQALYCEVESPQDVAAALKDFARREVEVVAISGGDGTIQAVLTALFKEKPFETRPLLAVPTAGTTSMIARDVGVRGSAAPALNRLLHWVGARDRDGVVLQRHVLRVETAPDQEPRFGMFFGAGVINQGIRFCHEKILRLGLRGEIGPGLTLAWFLLALTRRNSTFLEPARMTIGLDHDEPESHNVLAILVSTLHRLFLGMRPYWGRETAPLRFTVVTTGPRHLLRVLPSLLRGRPHRYGTPQHGYASRNVHEVRLALQGGFTLDGELYEADSRLGQVVLQDAGRVSFLRW